MVVRTSRDPDKADLLSSAEAAELMKCHPNTLRARVKKGLLDPVYVDDRKVPFFRKSEVLALLEKGRKTAPSDFPVHTDPFPVVAIATTAANRDRLAGTIKGLRSDLGIAYVVVADDVDEPGLREMMVHCPMPVIHASEGLQLEPDRAYLISAGSRSIVEDRRFKKVPATIRSGSSITDQFFRSLATEYRNKAVAVLLFSGDHASLRGARQIRNEGGIVIASDPFPENGNGAIKDTVADIILSSDRIGSALAGLYKHFFQEADAPRNESDLQRMLILLHQHRGVDCHGPPPHLSPDGVEPLR